GKAGAANSETRLGAKMGQGKLEEVGAETEVGVELDQKLPAGAVQRMIALVEGFDHTSPRQAAAAVLALEDADPGVMTRVFLDDGGGAVTGTIVHDEPLRWAQGLRQHALEGETYLVCLVAGRGDGDVDGIRRRHTLSVSGAGPGRAAAAADTGQSAADAIPADILCR